ncbi:MAG: ATP-binding protein [Nanoarchaeota archaeon]|nr:ATP-binding protein [Nanoarchaeota archaeon]
MDKTLLKQIIIDQQESFIKDDKLIQRDIDLDNYLKGNEIIIISGIRRCGKSSLLRLISKRLDGKKLFINFDDIRFTDFKIEDYQLLSEIMLEMYGPDNKPYLFFDEVQNLPSWERWVNNLHDQNYKIFVTGSNASLLSSEISTYLTGRNKVIPLFPFSFKEYLSLNNIEYGPSENLTTSKKALLRKLFEDYFTLGGFPLILRNNDILLSKQYFNDILYKDIINRYRIRQVKELKDLIIFLFSNVGNIYSYSNLKRISGIKSLSTIKNFIDNLESVFLCYQIKRFDFSIKKQNVSSSKAYASDNSFLKTISFNFSENFGRRLENLVFLHLKRNNNEIYYHLNKKECDFVVKNRLDIAAAYQVSYSLNDPISKKREIDGLIEAMTRYKLKKGHILTYDNEETIAYENKKIIILPTWKWMLEKNQENF